MVHLVSRVVQDGLEVQEEEEEGVRPVHKPSMDHLDLLVCLASGGLQDYQVHCFHSDDSVYGILLILLHFTPDAFSYASVTFFTVSRLLDGRDICVISNVFHQCTSQSLAYILPVEWVARGGGLNRDLISTKKVQTFAVTTHRPIAYIGYVLVSFR